MLNTDHRYISSIEVKHRRETMDHNTITKTIDTEGSYPSIPSGIPTLDQTQAR